MLTSVFLDPDGSGAESLIDGFIHALAMCREEGFQRVWLPQLPWQSDSLTVLAAALREVDTIEVGTGVVPIQLQHPAQLAQRALTTNLCAKGRLLLGIGVSHRFTAEGMWGISWDKPVRHMREYLDGLLPLLAGQPAEAVGEIVTTRTELHFTAPSPPVYLAALGPQMLRLAGRRSQGTITWMTGPKTLGDHIRPALRQAAADAGRDPSEVRVVAAQPISVTDDVDGIRAIAAQQFELYGQLPSYQAMLDLEGYSRPEDAVLIGDEQTVTENLDELRAAGVDEFVGTVFDPSPEGQVRTRALLRRYGG